MAVISVVRAKKTSADKPLPKSTLLPLALIRGVRVELIAWQDLDRIFLKAKQGPSDLCYNLSTWLLNLRDVVLPALPSKAPSSSQSRSWGTMRTRKLSLLSYALTSAKTQIRSRYTRGMPSSISARLKTHWDRLVLLVEHRVNSPNSKRTSILGKMRLKLSLKEVARRQADNFLPLKILPRKAKMPIEESNFKAAYAA